MCVSKDGRGLVSETFGKRSVQSLVRNMSASLRMKPQEVQQLGQFGRESLRGNGVSNKLRTHTHSERQKRNHVCMCLCFCFVNSIFTCALFARCAYMVFLHVSLNPHIGMFFHSFANDAISIEINTTADCCLADRGLHQLGLHSGKTSSSSEMPLWPPFNVTVCVSMQQTID